MKNPQEQAEILFKRLGIIAEISKPIPKVSDNWAQISFEVTFKKGKQSVKLPYSLGIGHVKYNSLPFNFKMGKGYIYEDLFNAIKDHKQIKKGYELEQAEIACELAKVQKVQPKASEVLAMYCRESLEAIQSDFEDWASNLGYDTDSRKGEKIYNTCRENYTSLLKLVNPSQIEELANLANEF